MSSSDELYYIKITSPLPRLRQNCWVIDREFGYIDDGDDYIPAYMLGMKGQAVALTKNEISSSKELQKLLSDKTYELISFDQKLI